MLESSRNHNDESHIMRKTLSSSESPAGTLTRLNVGKSRKQRRSLNIDRFDRNDRSRPSSKEGKKKILSYLGYL